MRTTQRNHPAADSTAGRIRRALERAQRFLEIWPEKGRGTAATEAVLTEGLRCEILEGDARIVTDVSKKMGGGGADPNPGMLGRGALGACVAMNVAMRAALLGVPVQGVKVRVEAEYDARGEYIPHASDPGYSGIRLQVTVQSDAPKEAIDRVLEEAQVTASFLDTFRRAVDVQVETTIEHTVKEEAA